MRIVILFFLILTTSLTAKECFKDKQADKLICYERYFERAKIYKAHDDEKYYTSSDGRIYAIDDKIEVRFNSVGAILFILEEYEIDFVDKTKGEKYIFQVRDKNKLFSMLRVLNNLTAVRKALPIKKRKYTKAYIEYTLKKRQEQFERMKKSMKK